MRQQFFFAKKQHKFSTKYAKILPHFLHRLEVFGEICWIMTKKIVLYSVFRQDFSARFLAMIRQHFLLWFNSKRQHFLHRLEVFVEEYLKKLSIDSVFSHYSTKKLVSENNVRNWCRKILQEYGVGKWSRWCIQKTFQNHLTYHQDWYTI